MEKILFLTVLLFFGSVTITQAKSTPIKLSEVRKNKGTIVRSIPFGIKSISTYLEDKTIQIELFSISSDISISIYDQNNRLIHQETATSETSRISIDVSDWDIDEEYTIDFTDQTDIGFIGSFRIE